MTFHCLKRYLLLAILMMASAQVFAVDSDGDGVDNSVDAFPSDRCGTTDTDGDGKPNELTCLAFYDGFDGVHIGPALIWEGPGTTSPNGYIGARSSVFAGNYIFGCIVKSARFSITLSAAATLKFYYRNDPGILRVNSSDTTLASSSTWTQYSRSLTAGTYTIKIAPQIVPAGATCASSQMYFDEMYIQTSSSSLVWDYDDDNDGVQDPGDAFPLNPAESVDTDNDGIGNNADTDDDNDGVADIADRYPLDVTRYQNPRHSTDIDSDSDVLVRSASTGAWTRYSVQSNAVAGSGVINAPTSSDNVYVAQLDANGDGDADILTRSASTGAWSLSIIENGAVTSTTPIYLYANLDQQFVGTGDFNNDGIDDVMLRSVSAGYYTVFLLANHAVNSTAFYNAWTAASSIPQGVGDFDGDGTDDLLVRRTSDNLYFIFKTTNGATNTTYCACNLWANPDWTFQFAGDTNKDGIDDIVIRGTGASADGKWWAFRMNNFSSVLTTNLNMFLNKTAVTVGSVGDYNGDGTIDVLTRVNNSTTYVSPIVNGTVTGNYWLYNFTTDQVIER